LLVLQNNKTHRYVYPTEEELEAHNKAVIELTYTPNRPELGWEVKKEHSFRGCPKAPASLYIRCREGETTYSLTIVPA
jgi:hypothetical protein